MNIINKNDCFNYLNNCLNDNFDRNKCIIYLGHSQKGINKNNDKWNFYDFISLVENFKGKNLVYISDTFESDTWI